MAKKKKLPKRVSINTCANGMYHDELRHKGPRASVEKDRSKVIPRKQKYKEKLDFD